MIPHRIRCLPRRVVLPILLAAAPACATSPCQTPGGCIDEASAALLLAIESTERHCSQAFPDHRQEYARALHRMLQGEDADFLARLRASAVYAAVRARIEEEEKLDADPHDGESLAQACERFAQ